MFKRLTEQILLNLGEMEDEFRLFHLRDDAVIIIVAASCALFANLAMLRVDFILFRDSPDLFFFMILARCFYTAIAGVFLFVVYRTKQAARFDVFVFAWLLFTAVYFSLLNFTRPTNYLTTTFDLLFIFGMYLLSPLPLKHTVALGISFSIGSTIVAYIYKPDVSAFVLGSAASAHVFIQMIGLASAMQVQSLRRRVFQAYARERNAHELTQDLLRVDALTRSLSRGYFFELAQREFERAKRLDLSMCVLVIDLDHFKKINDIHGHHAGDNVLGRFARFVMEHKRSQDIFGRLGGEEFGMILPGVGIKDALTVTKRIQTAWAKKAVRVDSKTIVSTMSVGVAEISDRDRRFDELLNRADSLMYKAKRRGRNRVAHK